MAGFRIFNDGKIKDYEGFVVLAKRARDFVEANEPDTITWECYANEEAGRGFFEESYTDEESFLTHFQNSIDHGFVDEILEVFELQNIRVPANITDPRVRQIIDQFGGVQLHEVQRMVR